jgi:hypothetical protein
MHTTTTAWCTVREAHVGTAHHVTSVSADVLLGITRHSNTTAARGMAAPKLAWACKGSSGASVWSTTLSQVLVLLCSSVYCFAVKQCVHTQELRLTPVICLDGS